MARQITVPPAAELSVQELEAARETAYGIEQKIKGAILLGREALWVMAQGFYEFEQTQGWAALGYEKLNDWLAQPEVSVTYRTFKRYTRAYRETVVNRQIPMETMGDVDLSKVDLVLPAIEANSVTVEEAFGDVKTLGFRDLQEKYIGAQSAPKTPVDGDEDDADASGTDSKGKAVGGDADAGEEPVTADEASDARGEGSEAVSGAQDAPQPYLQSGLQVDSWIEMGGDRRKAARHWSKLVSEHPVLQAINCITAFFEGAEDAPSKEEVSEAWKVLLPALQIDPEAA
jgi:hypothetical protein